MCFCVVIIILVNEDFVLYYVIYVYCLFCYFVWNCCRLYGEEFCVYNVYVLLYLKFEVDIFGLLEKCVVWFFENYM